MPCKQISSGVNLTGFLRLGGAHGFAVQLTAAIEYARPWLETSPYRFLNSNYVTLATHLCRASHHHALTATVIDLYWQVDRTILRVKITAYGQKAKKRTQML